MKALRGIFPVLITPFDGGGQIHEADLRSVVRFELAGRPHGLVVGGFASEAYKLTDGERLRCAEIVADEIGGRAPLIIGMAPGSLDAAYQQAESYARFAPVALMVLLPSTMANAPEALVEFCVQLADESPAPLMVQQSPHIPGFAAGTLSPDHLASIAGQTDHVHAFKIEGPASAIRIAALRAAVSDRVTLFGGVGGLALKDELEAGADGLLPGVGFNEVFMAAWDAWESHDGQRMTALLHEAQLLVQAVSGRGHEFSLHARKRLLLRAGLISSAFVRGPTVQPEPGVFDTLFALADSLGLRISHQA